MRRRLNWMAGLLVVLAGASGVIGSEAFAQTPVAQNRITQPVMIGGLRVDAVYVTAPGGGIQSFTCPSPQQYVTPDGASQGWACFDAATNVWLLSAVPPQQQAAPPAPALAPAPAPVVIQPVIQQPVVQQPVYSYPYPVVQPAVVYMPPPVVQPTVIYAPPPVVQPTVVYAPPPVYPRPAVAIGVASINAAGRIASALIYNSRSPHYEINNVRIYENRGHRRY